MRNNSVKRKKTLYAHVDESGQETVGLFFVVGVVLTGKREDITRRLEAVEALSKKSNIKWSKANWRYRRDYIEGIANLADLKGAIFYETFHAGTNYRELTANATANAARQKRGYSTLSVYVDGLRRNEVNDFKRYLKPSIKPVRIVVHGVRKDENNALIRLADVVCGLVSDVNDGDDWSVRAINKLKKNGLLL
ncbi:MAG: DUF3800 domain-containing protein [bacterium]